MCLISFAWQASAEYPFALVANRDEFHARPTDALGWWQNQPIVAGRDLQAGGTWLGLTANGRFAAITNVREGGVEQTAQLSRGLLVTHVLNSNDSLDTLALQINEMGQKTAGFNLLYGDLFGANTQLRFLSNRRATSSASHDTQAKGQVIKPGVYAFSNGGLDEDWPKTKLAERHMHRALRHRHPDGFWAVTDSRNVADPDELPDTGVGQDIERFLSSSFIVGDTYGTRSTLRVLGQPKANITLTERRFDERGELTGASQVRIERSAPEFSGTT